VQERGVALVRLGDEKAAGCRAARAAGAVDAPADDEGRVEAALGEHAAIRLVVVVLPWVPATAMP
jgi:hypothetical protein